MEGIGEQGLFIIAALVIAFINWLSTTLKKKQAAQSGDEQQEQVQAHQRQADEDAQAYLDADSWPSPDDDGEISQPDDPNREIREFFAALSGTPPVEAPPVPVMEVEEAPPVPPPPVEPVHELPSHGGYQIAARVGSSRRRSGQHPIVKKLRKEGGAREAFIFSEILGKPKSLQKTSS
jgi:hypothetical protein